MIRVDFCLTEFIVRGMNDTKKKTWRQLKAEGVTRCCATFTSGKQCRRRAITGENWCKNHISLFRTLQEINKEAIKQEETN